MLTVKIIQANRHFLRAGLECIEEVLHQSRSWGKWNITIGYKTGTLMAMVHTMAMTSLVENFDHAWKQHGCQHDNIFFLSWKFFGGQVS